MPINFVPYLLFENLHSVHMSTTVTFPLEDYGQALAKVILAIKASLSSLVPVTHPFLGVCL